MRFIHIADVHLGMQPDAGFPWSEERGEAIWESFRRIIRLAGRETDFLLIAGDLFQRQPLLRELKEVNDLFASIPETIVVLIAGNHDYVKRESFYRGFDWADNVVMLLSPEPECVEVPKKRTAVYGCSYDKKEILVDGEPVRLTPIEYNILLLLMKNQGRVFSTTQIYESIWNEDALAADNTVAVHVRHIREKIEINPREPHYLKVVWGLGYKIEKLSR